MYRGLVPVSQPLAAQKSAAGFSDGRCDVGIAGAGQLARMTCLAAWPLGIRVAVLGSRTEPAAPMAAAVVEGDWHDAEAVRALGLAARVVTLENEFVDAGALASVQAAGTPVRPGAAALSRVQDKALQKELVRSAGLPTAPSVVVEHAREIAAAGRELGWPLMLKAREAAAELGGHHLWLGVWERNPRAIAFYLKSGFAKVGSHDFIVGSDTQTDWVFVAPLSKEVP